MKAVIIFLSVLTMLLPLTAQEKSTLSEMEIMVDKLKAATGQENSVWWKSFSHIDRKFYLPESYRSLSYTMGEIMIHPQKVYLSPQTIFNLLESLEIRAEDKVLIAGYSTAYPAALINDYGAYVYLIQESTLTPAAQMLPAFVGSVNFLSWQSEAPFDGILITSPQKSIAPQLLNQLSEGALLICPLLSPSGRKQWVKVQKIGLSYEIYSLGINGESY